MMNKTQRRTLQMRLTTLKAELTTCTTKAMAASVQGSIDAVEWEIYLNAKKPKMQLAWDLTDIPVVISGVL